MPKSVVHEDPDKRELREIIAEFETKHPELKKKKKVVIQENILRGAEKADFVHRRKLGGDY